MKPLFGSLAPGTGGKDMLGYLGAGLLKNAHMNPAQAFGHAMSDYLQQAPEQANRQIQMQNAQDEMEERRQRRLRDSKLWTAIESDKAQSSESIH